MNNDVTEKFLELLDRTDKEAMDTWIAAANAVCQYTRDQMRREASAADKDHSQEDEKA